MGLGNQFYDNTGDGIYANGNVAVDGNTVYGQTTENADGILLSGTTGTENIVYSNYNGIVSTNSTVTYNRVYNNANVGIEGDGDATVTGNDVYGNYIGIESNVAPNSATGPFIINNLVYNNIAAEPKGATSTSAEGIWLTGGNSSQIDNNTVYQPSGDAVRIDAYSGLTAANIQVENNILWTQNGYDIALASASETGFRSDYNDLYFTTGGGAGLWENVGRVSLAAWNSASNADANSLSDRPAVRECRPRVISTSRARRAASMAVPSLPFSAPIICPSPIRERSPPTPASLPPSIAVMLRSLFPTSRRLMADSLILALSAIPHRHR